MLIWASFFLIAGAAAAADLYYYAGPDGLTRRDLAVSPDWTVALVDPGATAAEVSASLQAGGANVPAAQIRLNPSNEVALIPATGRLDSVVAAVRKRIGDGTIEASYRAFIGRGGLPWLEAQQLLVRLRPGVDRAAVWAAHDLTPLRSVPLGADLYLVQVNHPEDRSSVDVANDLVEEGVTLGAQPNFIIFGVWHADRRVRGGFNFVETDPLFSTQWHLANTGQGGGVPGADVQAPTAWDVSRGDPNVVVCIYDSGTDVDHEEFDVLVSNGAPKVHSQYDIVNDVEDARPNQEPHGTACAGVTTAAGANGLGGTGIAPDCRLMPVKIGDSFGASIQQLANGYLFARDRGAWIVSQSFGLGIQVGDQPVLDDAITSFQTDARGGQGGILLASAGNGNGGVEVDGGGADVNYPSSHPACWSVGSSTNFDVHSDYSDTGSVLRFVAPSSGGSLGIVTTDISGARGYTSGDYTNDFGGTSSACPLAAGVTALIWGVVPFLPQSQMLQILQSTAEKIGSLPYPGGRNNIYGAGRVDADAALQQALTLVGTTVSLTVTTVNGAQGKPLDAAVPVPVSYTDALDNPRTAFVYDGATVDIFVKDGTAVSFPSQVDDGATSRYVSLNAPTQVITAPITLNADYYHQLRRDFRVAVQPGAGVRGILFADNNSVSLKVTQTRGNQPPIEVNAQVPPGPATDFVQLWADAGSTYEFGTQASASDNDERWVATAQKTGTYALNDPAPTATFFHQSRPRVRLIGTNSQSTVNTERRLLFGTEDAISGVFGTFNEFCDNGSHLGFNDKTTSVGGEPVRGTKDAHEFQVATGLDTAVTYVAEAFSSESRVNVLNPRVAANGRTAATVEVFVRDSQGNPLDTPVAAERVGLVPTPTDGVQIITPTGVSDENGKLVFEVTRNLPGTVRLVGTVDGAAIPEDTGTPPADQIEFLRIMTVPMPVAGTYFLTFPITPDGDITPAASRQAVTPDPENSLEQIRTFDVIPQPAQMARLVDGTSTYVLFSELDKLQPSNPNYARFRELFRIAPGRGFFLRTNQPGSAELVGEWSTGTAYSFPMAEDGFHQLGNPKADEPLFWSLADFDVFENGVLVGSLADLVAAVQANPQAAKYVDPFAWAFTGSEYEQVTDPTVPGTDGLKTRLAVFEGFFWLSHRPGLELKYYPGRGRAAAPRPVTPSHFGVQLQAAVGDSRAVAIMGSYGRGMRGSAAPPAPDGPEAVRIEILTADGGRAAGDWVAGAVTQPTDWTVAVTTPAAGSEVTLSWPHLNRQLPRGYRVRLTDPTNGRSLLLNSSSSYAFTTTRAGETRPFTVTVVPRGEEGLRILSFQPTVGRGRVMSFGVQMTGEADLHLVVSSPSGRTIATTRPGRAAGTTSLTWNGLDAAGRPVPQGLYHVTLVAHSPDGEVRREMRVVRVR